MTREVAIDNLKADIKYWENTSVSTEHLHMAIKALQEPSINDTLNKIKTKIALLKHLNTGLTVYRWWNNAIDNCIHEIDYYITENEVEE